ncbi:hypothetical protein TNCV_932721 [Trichonephila clavipes]|nr:hypothetical protein TNCV_932721 [Trichonephila clavipes]
MNFHNLHTWADENPHAIRPHGAQQKCSINVWAGIVGDCLLGPYILPEGLNGSVYLTFLQEVLLKMLNDVPMPIRQRIRFQHDGAPAHFSIDVRAHLQATFPGGWIGRGGPIAWPARSPDLSPLDFFLWGFLKGLVYETPVATPEDLVGRIVEAAGCVRDTPGIFEKVFGVIFNLSDAILGLTILAWGNSLSDFLSNIAVARKEFPRMAISACFGGPLLALLLGLGIPCIIEIIKGRAPPAFPLMFSSQFAFLFVSIIIGLLMTASLMIIWKFHTKRAYGIFLISLYVLFMTLSVLTELKVFSLPI